MDSSNSNSQAGMPLRSALSVLANARQAEDVVITNQGSSRVWPLIAQHPLDFHLNPSTMGGAIPFGVGIALAHPQREVIVLTGDGSLLMSMGSLVTVMAAGCNNLTIVLLDNNIYDVTGGQKTAASDLKNDYHGLARSVGFPTVDSFNDLAGWTEGVTRFLQSQGPRFAWLQVDPALADDMKTIQEPMDEQLSRIGHELGC